MFFLFFLKQLINSGFWIFYLASKARSRPFDHLIFGPQMKDATQQLNKRLFCLPGSRPRALKVEETPLFNCFLLSETGSLLKRSLNYGETFVLYLHIRGLKGRKQILTRLRLNPPWMSRGTLSLYPARFPGGYEVLPGS